MILESRLVASRIFGPEAACFAPKLDTGHGFDLPTATPGTAMSKLLVRLTKYGNQRKTAVT